MRGAVLIAKLVVVALIALVAAPLVSFHQLSGEGAGALLSISGEGGLAGVTRLDPLLCDLLP